MEASVDVAVVIREVLRSRTPLTWRDRELPDDLRLGGQGLGLDSVSIVELMLDCEEALAISFAADLFDGPMTVGRLVDYAVRAAAERAAT
jgi:acyl carrier protein